MIFSDMARFLTGHHNLFSVSSILRLWGEQSLTRIFTVFDSFPLLISPKSAVSMKRILKQFAFDQFWQFPKSSTKIIIKNKNSQTRFCQNLSESYLFELFFWKSKNFQLFGARQAPNLTFSFLKTCKNAKAPNVLDRTNHMILTRSNADH